MVALDSDERFFALRSQTTQGLLGEPRRAPGIVVLSLVDGPSPDCTDGQAEPLPHRHEDQRLTFSRSVAMIPLPTPTARTTNQSARAALVTKNQVEGLMRHLSPRGQFRGRDRSFFQGMNHQRPGHLPRGLFSAWQADQDRRQADRPHQDRPQDTVKA